MSRRLSRKVSGAKGKAKELIPARKSAELAISALALDALVELVRRDVIHQLGEDGAADRHAPLSVHSAGQASGGQKALLEVGIDKSSKPTHPHKYTGLIRQTRSDSRTVLGLP